MYPTLPRWSDAAAGAALTAPRTSKPGVVPRHSLQHGAEVTPQEIILPAPSTRLSSLPAVAAATATTTTTATAAGTAATQQAKRAGRSGVLFVNHNLAPSDATAAASPHVSAPSPSSSPALPPAGAASPAAASPHRGGGGSRAAGHSRQLMRGGGGASPEGLHGAGPSYTTNRHGLVRGSTVANAVDALHGEEEPLSLGVEGVQTGEGVVVEVAAAPHRRSLTNSSGATACPNPQDHLLVSQLKRQLEKVNASVKSLTAGSRRQKQDQDNQQAKWELQRAESDARLRLVLTNAREREALLLQYAAEARKRCVAQVEGEKQARAAAVTAHNADKTRWDGEMASLRRALDAAGASLAAHAAKDSTAAAHQADLAQMDAALAALHQSAAETQHELEAALATAQSALNKTTVELHESRQAVHQCNYLAQQCRLFIRQVCQPGFSVVKGSSLEPVEKDRPEPTGFVLVPLTVLLHGYTLLPEGDRQEVIDHYDKEAKALH